MSAVVRQIGLVFNEHDDSREFPERHESDLDGLVESSSSASCRPSAVPPPATPEDSAARLLSAPADLRETKEASRSRYCRGKTLNYRAVFLRVPSSPDKICTNGTRRERKGKTNESRVHGEAMLNTSSEIATSYLSLARFNFREIPPTRSSVGPFTSGIFGEENRRNARVARADMAAKTPCKNSGKKIGRVMLERVHGERRAG